MFLFWFSVRLFTSRMQKKSTKTSCINLSINFCLWESPWPVVCLSPIYVCMCVFPVCVHVLLAHTRMCERDSLLHMLHWRPWCRRGRGACVLECMCQPSPFLPPPPSPPKKIRPWCSQHLPYEAGVESLKEQDYSQTSCLSYRFQHQGTLVFICVFDFCTCFVPAYKVANNALKQTQMYDLYKICMTVYDIPTCITKAIPFHCDGLRRGAFMHYTAHTQTQTHHVIAPWTSSSPAAFLLRKVKMSVCWTIT